MLFTMFVPFAWAMFIPLSTPEDLNKFNQAEAQLIRGISNPLMLTAFASPTDWPKWEQSEDVQSRILRRIGNASSLDGERYSKFSRSLQVVVAETGIQPVYVVESPSYFVEHLMPLFLAVPGWIALVHGGKYSRASAEILIERFGFPLSSMILVNQEALFTEDSKALLLACTGPTSPGSIGDRWASFDRAITLPHGVDEDPTYCNNHRLDASQPPESWRDLKHTHVAHALTRAHFGGTRAAVLEELRSTMHLDPSRQTILYISTVGDFEFLDPKGPPGLAQRVWEALLRLKSEFNVMVSLHPLLTSNTAPVLALPPPGRTRKERAAAARKALHTQAECAADKLANNGMFPTSASAGPGSCGQMSLQAALHSQGMLVPSDKYLSFMPLLDQADIVIAPVSSGGKGAVLHSPAKPLVLLRPQRAWDGTDAAGVASRNDGLVLGEDTAEVLDEDMQPADLVFAVKHELLAHADHDLNQPGAAYGAARVAARKAHRQFWFGDVDGYEDLRTWLALLSFNVEGFRSSKAMAGLAALYGSVLVAAPSHGGTLANALDHPLITRGYVKKKGTGNKERDPPTTSTAVSLKFLPPFRREAPYRARAGERDETTQEDELQLLL